MVVTNTMGSTTLLGSTIRYLPLQCSKNRHSLASPRFRHCIKNDHRKQPQPFTFQEAAWIASKFGDHQSRYTFRTRSQKPSNPHSYLLFMPKSVSDRSSSCKIVYICRDTKDTSISMYHFFAKVATSRNIEPMPLGKAFELFCNGESSFGPYWHQVLGYWKASLDQPDKVMFLSYEELKEDTAFYVAKLARFIGYGFTDEEEGDGVVEKIVRMCSFDHMSNLEVNKNGKFQENTPLEMNNNVFFRKGSVEDWENYLTPDMAAHIDSGLNLIYSSR